MKKKPKTEEQLFRLDVRYVAKCIRAMREALQDALNVFTEKGQLVTAERREAWERALKMTDGDPRPKLPPGWMWAEVSVPESDLGPDFYDGRALALMDAAKCKATMDAYLQASRMAKVCLDMHYALGIKWGDDPYARIRELVGNTAKPDEALRLLRAEGGNVVDGRIVWTPMPGGVGAGPSTANAGAVPRRGSDVGTSPLLGLESKED